MIELTPVQRTILIWILGFMSKHGHPPVLREICKAMGWSSPSTADQHLVRLEAKGVIERDATVGRGLRITDRGMRAIVVAGAFRYFVVDETMGLTEVLPQ